MQEFNNKRFTYEEFRKFILGILKYNCLLKQSTIDTYFDNPATLKLVLQAFIHKSYHESGESYELLEFEGDTLLNNAVVEYIREKYPQIQTEKWCTSLKHYLISGHVLAKVSTTIGFDKFAVYGPLIEREMKSYKDNLDDAEEVQKMYEDIVEAFCGVIVRILNKHTVLGVGYVAVHYLIYSLLDQYPIDIYDLKDGVSLMKEFFDDKRLGWNRIPGCTSHDCLKVLPMYIPENLLPKGIDRSSLKTITKSSELYPDQLQTLYQNPEIFKRYQMKTSKTFENVDWGNNFVGFGYACIDGNPNSKTLISIISANKLKTTKHKVGKKVVELLQKKYNIKAYLEKPK